MRPRAIQPDPTLPIIYDGPRRWLRFLPHSVTPLRENAERLVHLVRLRNVGHPGDVVYCHPDRVLFWMALPPYVSLYTYPDMEEVTKRLVLEPWARKLSGFTGKTEPKPGTKRYLPWKNYLQLLESVGESRQSEQSLTAGAAPALLHHWCSVLNNHYGELEVALDTETDVKKGADPRPTFDPILGVSIAGADWEVWIPADEAWCSEVLRSFVSSRKVIGHHCKFDALVTRRLGLNVNFTDDTMLMAYSFGDRYPLGLKALTGVLLDRPAVELGNLITQYGSTGAIPEKVMVPYAKADARNTYDCAVELRKKGLDPLYSEMEMPISALLTDMEEAGWRVDNQRLKAVDFELQQQAAYSDFRAGWLGLNNTTSPKQVAEFFIKAGYSLPRTKTGHSVDREVLEGIDHPVASEVLSSRQAKKRRSTWLKAMIEEQDEHTYIHPSFRQAPRSGRLSCTGINVQNFPPSIRSCLVPDLGEYLIAADASQFELRILACQTGDPTLIDEFKRGVDVHELNRLELGFDNRREAKNTIFGVGYGEGPVDLAKKIHRDIEICRRFIHSIYRKYSCFQPYKDKVIREARVNDNTVFTMMGRARWVPELEYQDINMRMHGERVVVNHTIQGTAADLMKLGMELLKAEGIGGKLGGRGRQISQNHDEFIVSTSDPFYVYQALMKVEELFSEWLYPVPFHLEIMLGPNWGMK